MSYRFVSIPLLFVSAIIFQESEAAEKIQVGTRLGNDEEEIHYLNDVLAPMFFEASGIRVSFEYFKDEKLLYEADNSQVGNKSYDLVILHESEASKWQKKGLLRDLTAFFKKLLDQQQRSFHAPLDRNTVFSGKRYFVPLLGDVYLTLARAKALRYKNAGTRFQNLSWDDIVIWSKNIAEAGDNEHDTIPKPFAFAAVPNTAMIYQASAAILAFGGSPEKIDSREARQAWKTLAKLKQYMHPDSSTSPYVAPLLTDNLAWLTIAHCARIGRIVGKSPGMFEVAPPPLGNHNGSRGSILGVHSIAVMNHSPNQAASLKLVEFLSRPNIQVELARNLGGYIPSVAQARQIIEQENSKGAGQPVDAVIFSGMKLLESSANRVNFGFRSEAKDRRKLKLVFDKVFKSLSCKSVNKSATCNPVVDPEVLQKQQRLIDELL